MNGSLKKRLYHDLESGKSDRLAVRNFEWLLCLFALPVGIIATGFAQEIHRREFVVTWGMVAKVPLFCELSAADLIEIANLLQSRTVEAGSVIIRRGEIGDCMYLILSGEVSVDLPDRTEPERLTDGDYFGEIALLHNTERRATIMALTKCHLLILEVTDLNRLMETNPGMARCIRDTVAQRLSSSQHGNRTAR